MDIKIIILILLIHWLADFVFQTYKQARGKSNNLTDLLSHTLVYTFIMCCFILGYSGNNLLLTFYFGIITLIAHTITDYFTSRINKKLWLKNDVHNFFVLIGFDQWLHYVQLFVTYKLLFL